MLWRYGSREWGVRAGRSERQSLNEQKTAPATFAPETASKHCTTSRACDSIERGSLYPLWLPGSMSRLYCVITIGLSGLRDFHAFSSSRNSFMSPSPWLSTIMSTDSQQGFGADWFAT